MLLNLFDSIQPCITIEEIFDAYYRCRANKRNTSNALSFEIDFEHSLVQLYQNINDYSYQIGKSIAFIVDKPVKREIFAADFRDRVVHHLIIHKINHLFEKQFIYDSYGCRVGKGTHFGIKRVDTFIRRCSMNYSRDCYVLKLDIEGFFMHINKDILYERLVDFVNAKYSFQDKTLLLDLYHKVIYNDPTRNCIIKGKRSDWYELPKTKSLFHASPYCGLPIGNLTSQILANFYMDSFDHYIKSEHGIKYYG